MKLIENICYATRQSEDLHLNLYLPDSDNFALFVYFHGGGLEEGDRKDPATQAIGSWLAEKGIAVASVDYRLYPTAKYPDFIQDAAESVCWLSNHINEYGNCEKIFVGGSSAGGYLSMMLCFNKRWYADVVTNTGCTGCKNFSVPVAGYFHDAGQPTSHFNVLREREIDTRRLIIDEAAPLYYIGMESEYPPMMFVVSDNDIENRFEQTQLLLSTMRHFGYDDSKIFYQLLHGSHCEHDTAIDENGDSVFGKLIFEFIQKVLAKSR